MRPQDQTKLASTQWRMRQTCSMNPLNQKMTMKKNSILWAALSMTAALMMTACSSSDDSMTEAPVAPSTTKAIPYTVTVGGDEATTRATVDSDNKTLRFASGDKLYITGTDIQGVLDLQAGDEGKTTGATFSGELTYDGSGSPADGLSLTATLVSAQQTVGTQVSGAHVSVDAAGAVTVNYPTSAYCADVATAVQKYSRLTGTSTYGAKAFSLTQQTAFLNFEITVTGGTPSGTTLPANVISNGASIAKANVTTVTDGGVKAKFVLPVPVGTTLTSATVKLGGIEIGSAIGNASLSSGKVYNVKRTVVMPSVTLAQTKTTADMAVKVNFNYNSRVCYCLFASNGNSKYTFLSGDTYFGGNSSRSRDLAVEDGKLVFKANWQTPITKWWDTDGYSVTFDTSNSTYSEWVGAYNIDEPSFISVEVNGTTISLSKASKITVDDLVKENYQSWVVIVSNNSDKIYFDDDGYVRRCSDGAMLKQSNDGEFWNGVGDSEYYDPYYSYKFDGD